MINNDLLWSMDEYEAVVDYIGDGYDRINVLLSRNLTRRETIDEMIRYNIPQTQDEFLENIEKIVLIYSAIRKNYVLNGRKKYNKVFFRGARDEKISSSFLSTSISAMVAYYFSKEAILAIDPGEVPGINVSDIIPSGDCNSTEQEFLFLPTETISVEPISIQNFFDIAIEQGEEIIVSCDMLKEGASCYCGKVFVRELDYSNEKVEITLDELCNLFNQYRQDIMIIRGANKTSKEYTEAYIRVMQFKKNCTTFIYQKFHETNLIVDNQDIIKNSAI